MAADLERILRGVTRPARYTGNEWNSVVKDWQGRLHVALAYPDVYEEGVCDDRALALYAALNRDDSILCERVYVPCRDMDEALRAAGMPLYVLESRRSLADFDIVLVVLPDELHFPAVLTLLELAGLAVRASHRGGQYPLVVGVGPGTANPEPLAEFFDAFLIGEVDGQVVRETAAALRSSAARLPAGLYVPSLYRITYQADAAVGAISPPAQVIARDIDGPPPPLTRPIVPFVEASRERAVVELAHPPVYPWAAGSAWRERPQDEILAAVEAVLGSTGYDHVHLVGWHERFSEIAASLSARYRGRHTHFTVGPLAMKPHVVDQADRLPHVRRGALSFDLVAGSEHLRSVHGGGESDQEVLDAARLAFQCGWHILKLQVGVGLPEETLADVQSIALLARKVAQVGQEETQGRAQVQVVASPFVPRAHSRWERQGLVTGDEWALRVETLKRGVRAPGLRLGWRGLSTRLVEAALARGDRRVGSALEHAWRAGMRRPADAENPGGWEAAFVAAGLDMAFYGSRERGADEALPWGRIAASREQRVVSREQ